MPENDEHFYHIAFNFKSGKEKISKLEPIFNKALDWYRYAPNCWILYSNSTPQQWSERIKLIVDDADLYFICELDVKNRSGWMPKGAWEWLNKDRN